MRRLLSALALSSLTCGGLLIPAHAEVNVNVSINANEGYALGLSNYYGVPRDRVLWLADEGLSYEEVTVALYIADLANVDPFEVADLRLSGMSWMEVSHYYGLGADIYYIENLDPIGPYSAYYDPFRRGDRGTWVSLSLSDDAIVNLTYLLFASQLYDVSPRYVMDYRSRGDNFIVINERLYREHGDIPRRRFSRDSIRRETLPQTIQVQAKERGAKVLADQPTRERREKRNRRTAEQAQPKAGQNPGQVNTSAPETNPDRQPAQVNPGSDGPATDRNPGDRPNREERGQDKDKNPRQDDQPGRVKENVGTDGGQMDGRPDQPGREKEGEGDRGQGGQPEDRNPGDRPNREERGRDNDKQGQDGQPDRKADQPQRQPKEEPRRAEPAPQPEQPKEQPEQPKEQPEQPKKPDQDGGKEGGGKQGQPHGDGKGKP